MAGCVVGWVFIVFIVLFIFPFISSSHRYKINQWSGRFYGHWAGYVLPSIFTPYIYLPPAGNCGSTRLLVGVSLLDRFPQK